MALIAYCFALEHQGDPTLPPQGLKGSQVRALSIAGLTAWWSDLADAASFVPGQQEVLDFHRVIERLAQQQTVIPFRFPTVLRDEEALRAFLKQNAGAYRRALTLLEGMVQMEVNIALADPERQTAASGREYLRLRQEAARRLAEAAAEAQRAAGDLARRWQGCGAAPALRCYALVRRSDAAALRALITQLGWPAGVQVRVTGPWPPAAFFQPETGPETRS